MREVPLALALPLLITATASPALASDLKLDGQTSVSAAIGSTVTLELTGGANLPAAIAADISPGPVNLLGESVPIGLTPVAFLVIDSMTDGAGSLTTPLTLPSLPGLAGVSLYFVGFLLDPSDPNQFDFSQGADLTITLPPTPFTTAELAGIARTRYPYFSWVTTAREGDDLEIAVDPSSQPQLAGLTADVYVTADKSSAQWDGDPTLLDMTLAGATSVTFDSVDIKSNTFIVDAGTLSGDAGAGLGVGYDVVVDVNNNGVLDAGDLIDGYDDAGIYVAADTAVPGPYAVTEVLYSGGTWLGQNLYYPSNIASLGELPLVVVSHGNGHNYQWYGHIGDHLASYGYIVMSHQNNTVPGIQTASTTTLTNTDYFLGNLATIEGGALQGHVDLDNIVWLGHSRGGEGVARAYDKLLDGVYIPENYSPSDIVLISSIAPTDFLGTNSATPHNKPYHLWVGGGDSDVTGCASSNIVQSFHLLGRAEDQRQSISLHGVGHGNFHDSGGNQWVTGPCQIGKVNTHTVMLGYILPLVEFHTRGNPAAKDFLWRQYEDLAPQSAPTQNPCVVVDLQYRDAIGDAKLVIDDFQTADSPLVASSGATISFTTTEWVTGLYDDPDSNFTYSAAETFNGFTSSSASDSERGAVLSFDGPASSIVYDIESDDEDWSGFGFLSFRACQVTRDPATTSNLGDSFFTVRLVDADGDSSSININTFGGGIEEPYQRTSCGTGAGWANEFETIRLDLNGFLVGATAVDLDRIDRMEFLFGPGLSSPAGRLGLDDIELNVN